MHLNNTYLTFYKIILIVFLLISRKNTAAQLTGKIDEKYPSLPKTINLDLTPKVGDRFKDYKIKFVFNESKIIYRRI